MNLAGLEENHILVSLVRYIGFGWIGKNEERSFDVFIDFDAQVLWVVEGKPDLVPVIFDLNIPAFRANVEVVNRRGEGNFDLCFPFERKGCKSCTPRIVNKNRLSVHLKLEFGRRFGIFRSRVNGELCKRVE